LDSSYDLRRPADELAPIESKPGVLMGGVGPGTRSLHTEGSNSMLRCARARRSMVLGMDSPAGDNTGVEEAASLGAAPF